jgi:hypothetical protein
MSGSGDEPTQRVDDFDLTRRVPESVTGNIENDATGHGTVGRSGSAAQRNTIDWCDGISNRRRHRVQLTMSSTR